MSIRYKCMISILSLASLFWVHAVHAQADNPMENPDDVNPMENVSDSNAMENSNDTSAMENGSDSSAMENSNDTSAMANQDKLNDTTMQGTQVQPQVQPSNTTVSSAQTRNNSPNANRNGTDVNDVIRDLPKIIVDWLSE